MFERTFEALGKTWTLEFTHRSRILIKNETGLKERQVDEVFGDKNRHDAEVWAVMMHQGLKKHHPDITRDKALDILDTLASVEQVEILGDAWVRAGTGKPLDVVIAEAAKAAASGPLAGLPGGAEIATNP